MARRRSRQSRYFVVPENRTRRVNADPGGWKVTKGPTEQGANTVETFEKKRPAIERAKELARKRDALLLVFDAPKKSSRAFDYR